MRDNLGAETLRAKRTELGLSQAKFGRLVNAHQSQVARWESGKKPDATKRVALLPYGIGFDWWEKPATKKRVRVSSRDRTLRTAGEACKS